MILYGSHRCQADTPSTETDHGVKLTDLPDDQMADILPVCKKLAKATVRPALKVAS